jgi:glycosyltransferase involved in cell wall biosynthesis/spore maturation protein CgeB
LSPKAPSKEQQSKHRVLVYGDIDMNMIDGSSIWVSSIVKVLALSTVDSVHLLLKSARQRDILLKDLEADPKVSVIDPFQRYRNLLSNGSLREKRMVVSDAARVITHLMETMEFSFVLLRGHAINLIVSSEPWSKERLVPYLIWKSVNNHEDEQRVRAEVRTITERCQIALVQTPESKEQLINDGSDGKKLRVLPPMIPDHPPVGNIANVSNKLVYIGQLKKDYNALEMIEAVEELSNRISPLSLEIAGDKFSRENADQEYLDRLTEKLHVSKVVLWHKGLDRDASLELIKRCDVGIVWRKEAMDHVPEISTKLLEYGAMGKPVIANRNAVNVGLLGADYPLFVNGRDEFIAKVELALKRPDTYRAAGIACHQASNRFQFSNVAKDVVATLLNEIPVRPIIPKSTTKSPGSFDVRKEIERIRKVRIELNSILSGGKEPVVQKYKPENERWKDVKDVSDLRVACILDDFSNASFGPECRLSQLTPDGWREEMHDIRPHLLLVESAWSGKNSLWTNKVVHLSDELLSILDHCKQNGIPTVFWNKEDPVHFDRFVGTAASFDIIFTTDLGCIPRYKSVTGNEKVYVLPFATQPRLHNPKEKYDRVDGFCFAGSYYATRHSERQNDFDIIMDGLARTGKEIAIYDRNFERDDPQYRFPAQFKRYIKGSLPVDQIDRAYKGYRYGVNFNSIKASQSMFARRVFELASSNTLVVSNFSLGMRNLFGDLTICTDDAQEMASQLRSIYNDEIKFRKIRLAALRKVLREHTYRDRLTYLVNKTGRVTLERKGARITTFSKVGSMSELELVIGSHTRQDYQNSHLVVLCQGFQPDIEIPPHVTLYSTEQANTVTVSECAIGGWLAWYSPKDHYGEHYLKDLATASLYCNHTVIGKGAYYRRIDDSLIMTGEGTQYRDVGTLQKRCGISRFDDNVGKMTVEDICQDIEGGSLVGRCFAIDEFNYCMDDPSYHIQEVDDLEDLDQGGTIEQLEMISDGIPIMTMPKDGYFEVRPPSLGFERPSGSLAMRASNGEQEITSTLNGDDFRYIYFINSDLEQFLLNNSDISVHLDAISDMKIGLVVIFLDSKGTKLKSYTIPHREYLNISRPDGSVQVRTAIRVQGRGKVTVRSIKAMDWRSIDAIWSDAFAFDKRLAMDKSKMISSPRKVNLLFAGHDFKFIEKLINWFQSSDTFAVKVDQWHSHAVHDKDHTAACLQWADVVVCEWGLGNLAFYSKNKRPGQILICRVHRQELTTPHHGEVVFANVDRMVFIAPHVKDQYIALSGLAPEKAVLIDNYVDPQKVVDGERIPEAQFNLGLVGIVPKLKDPLLALEIFEKVWANDNRSKLIIKGRRPEEYEWLLKRPEEMQYYQEFYQKLDQAKYRDNVVFAGFQEDMREFYSSVGFLLSTSEIEGSHQSVAEAIVAGVIPIVRNWTGASSVYPMLTLFTNAEEAAIRIIADQENMAEALRVLQSYRPSFTAEHTPEAISKKWADLIDALRNGKEGPSGTDPPGLSENKGLHNGS